ncbi:MAG TPA: L-aspartate oxidase [Acidobacteriota bacterium]|nr:L-aspartate oxidase [Acidobacteriota bacterium]
MDEVLSASALVMGAGVAGLSAALGLAERLPRGGPVVVLSKTPLQSGCSSVWAQGGIAAAIGSDDSPDLHAEDTLAVAGGIGDDESVRLLAGEAPRQIARLIGLGTRFDAGDQGKPALGREAAHRRNRILHANGDATGLELTRALTEAARLSPRLDLRENAFALDFVVDSGRVQGLLVRLEDGSQALFTAPIVVMASGGLGRLYLHTTNPPEATADGLAMAARAGVLLADLEFVQFHPTAQHGGGDPMPLLTEALRGEGATLIDERGRRFMPDIHRLAELAPRDVVARAIWEQRQRGLEVYLDARDAVGDRFPQRFPTVFESCRKAGLDPRRQPIPASPAAHYYIGGAASDTRGRTSLPGLWVCGEASATGVHGANRLASNSLMEGLVFGARVAADASARLRDLETSRPQVLRLLQDLAAERRPARSGAHEEEPIQDLRGLMWRDAGLVRSRCGLESGLRQVRSWQQALFKEGTQASWERINLLQAAQLILRAALRRRESRGVHFRRDFPASDPGQACRLYFDSQRDRFTAHQAPRPAVGR